jgi:hypothetical protein
LSKPKVAVTSASKNNYKASISNLRLVERSVATRDGQLRALVKVICIPAGGGQQEKF